jgi:hypothetical protein
MRATFRVVVLSSLLTGATAFAAPDDKKGTAPGSGAAPAPAPVPGTAPTGAPTPTPMAAPAAQDPATAPGPTAAVDPATVRPEDMPTAVRMRRLEQRTQALKERAWQLQDSRVHRAVRGVRL